VTDSAEAFAGNESVGKIASGSVLRYSDENGPWLLIPRYGGWLSREHVVGLERAVEYFTGIIAREPTPQAFHHRGIAQMSLGRYNDAIADYTRAITQGLTDPGVFINRGVARQRLGNLKAAVEDFTRAIEIDPDSARAHDNRAGALSELGQYDASLADSDAAVRLSPRFAEAYNNRGVTRRMQGDYQQALADYSQAIELYEGYAAAFANRGYAHKQLGDLAQAVSDYEQAIELDPQAPAAYNDLAWLLATTANDSVRDADRAGELAARACELTRDRNADYLDTLAAALAARGDFPAAVARAEAALALAPVNARPPIQARLALYRSQMEYREQ
jgi:tetratricopeptide (TPR) repeat protein